jgi:hypothetical protein
MGRVLARMIAEASPEEVSNAAEVLCAVVGRNEGVDSWKVLIAYLITRPHLDQLYQNICPGASIPTLSASVAVLTAVFEQELFSIMAKFDYDKLIADTTDSPDSNVDTEEGVMLEEDDVPEVV